MDKRALNDVDGGEEQQHSSPSPPEEQDAPLYPTLPDVGSESLPMIAENGPTNTFSTDAMSEKQWARKRTALDGAALTPGRAAAPLGAQFVPGRAPGALHPATGGGDGEPNSAESDQEASPLDPGGGVNGTGVAAATGGVGVIPVDVGAASGRPGAQSVPGRAPGNVPVWGRRVRELSSRLLPGSSRSHRRGGSRGSRDRRGSRSLASSFGLEATAVTDAHPVVYATSVSTEEDENKDDCRQSLFRHRHVGVLVAVLLAVIVGLILVVVDLDESSSQAPSPSPEAESATPPTPHYCDSELEEDVQAENPILALLWRCRCRDGMENSTLMSERMLAFKKILDPNLFMHEDDNGIMRGCSSDNMALMWIAHGDERTAHVNETALISETVLHQTTKQHNVEQRYAMAAFFFATGGDWWAEDDNEDKYYPSLRSSISSWLNDTHECEWHGVSCQYVGEGTVQVIKLENHTLNGTLPSDIARLSELKILSLERNHIGGPIPPEVNHLTELRILKLESNQITGHINSEIVALTKLHELSLGNNSIMGRIPTELGNMKRLKHLGLEQNSLIGQIPSELGAMERLRFLLLSDNNLNGTIPTELGMFQDLAAFVLSNNALSGTVPRHLSSLHDLEILCLQGNDLDGGVEDGAVSEEFCKELVYIVDICVDPSVPCRCTDACSNCTFAQLGRSLCRDIVAKERPVSKKGFC